MRRWLGYGVPQGWSATGQRSLRREASLKPGNPASTSWLMSLEPKQLSVMLLGGWTREDFGGRSIRLSYFTMCLDWREFAELNILGK